MLDSTHFWSYGIIKLIITEFTIDKFDSQSKAKSICQ